MNTNPVDRRDFLKKLSLAAAASTAALVGCGKKNASSAAAAKLRDVPTDKMTYRVNPKTGDKVSLLGYGCMRWPLRQKPDGSGEEIDQEAVNALTDYAIAHGVNYFDTSPRYIRGWSERATGLALSRHPRDKYFIATKLSNFDPSTQSREASIAMYHQSMKELQVDYLDYYLLHNVGGSKEDVQQRYLDNGMLDFMLQERQAGRIRNLGWSFHGKAEIFDYVLAMDIPWDFVQIQLNYVDWKNASGWNINAEYLYAELEKRNIPAVIMEPLLGGRLSRLNANTQAPLRRLDPEASPAAWALRYAGTPEKILTVLSGMVYPEHLQEDICVYSPLQPLVDKEYTALEEVTELMLRSNFIQCTDCQYCMPCPYGLNIPGIFAHYNRCISEGNLPQVEQDTQASIESKKSIESKSAQNTQDARDTQNSTNSTDSTDSTNTTNSTDTPDAHYRAARRAFLVGYDRSVPKLRQAAHCTGCGLCLPKCPQSIPIVQTLEKIDKYAEALRRG